MTQRNPPLLLALILCDHTIREAVTNKVSLIGVFNGLWARRFPFVHPSLCVYAALTDGRDRVPCCLRLRHSDTDRQLFALQGEVNFADPTSVPEMVFEIQHLRFEQPGDYLMEFLADGELLGARKFRVQAAPPEGQMPPKQ